MPAATPPPPTLEDLVQIFSKMILTGASPGYDEIQLIFNLRERDVAEGWIYASEWPSLIIPALLQYLQMLKEMLGLSSVLEEGYRGPQPKKSIEDAISFITQELNQDTSSLGTLYTKQRQEHFNASLKYLRELDRRRRDADARKAAAERLRDRQREENARKAADDEKRRREQAEAAKKEARERWEREEFERKRRESHKTSDSGFSGTHDEFKKMWEDAFRAGDSSDWRKQYEQQWSNPFGGPGNRHRSEQRAGPQPSAPGGKRRWFEVLGVQPSASKDEIRKASRKLASQFHPDKHNGNPEMSRKMQEVNNARDEGLDGL